ncbi:tetratricopeptide repeat protein, partial [Planktothrix sp.]|uniref:tetratricopeptide repeat protein n=1 Tax=Planktothrix sp. TaxID=3088171 RepID=UPI0038D4D3EC
MKNQTEFQKGIELKRQGKFEEAIAAYRRSIETNPGFSWTYYMLGETLAELGRLEEAVSSYKKAIALNSEPDCFHSKLEQALNQLDCQDVKGLVNSNSKTSNLDEIQAPIKGELETKGQVNHAFLSMSRKFWNVNSMQEAMFDRVITGPEFNRLPLEKKIELWEKSAVASVEQILQDIPVKQEWKVLDIGCGVGRCIKPMRDLFLEVDGVDISAKMIEFAKEY